MQKISYKFKTENAVETFLQYDENVFLAVHKLLKYLINLFLTTLKIYLRKIVLENKLNGLVLLNLN
jgi:hypothetical protein